MLHCVVMWGSRGMEAVDLSTTAWIAYVISVLEPDSTLHLPHSVSITIPRPT